MVHHPYLLGDKECLATVVEVAELGVSGSKSQQKASEPPVMKVGGRGDAGRNIVSVGFRTDEIYHLISGILKEMLGNTILYFARNTGIFYFSGRQNILFSPYLLFH